jgi:uncharacterized membrane protein
MAKRSVQKTTQTAMENKQSDNELTVPPPIINERGLAFAVYVLYLVGYITGITVLIGVVIAYSQAARSARWCWSVDPLVGVCVVACAKRKGIIGAQSQ